MFIIPKDFDNATVWEQLEYALKLFCSLIYVIGGLAIKMIRFFSEILMSNIRSGETSKPYQPEDSTQGALLPLRKNPSSRDLIQEQQTLSQINKKIEGLKQEEQKLTQQLKNLKIQIGWSMDYIQLSKEGKDTSYLDKFREKLELQFYDPDTDDPQNHEPDSPDPDSENDDDQQ